MDPLIEAYNKTLRFEFDSSSTILEKHADQPGAIYLAHMNEAIKLFISEDELEYETFKVNSETRIKDLRNQAEGEGPYQLFYISEIKLHETFLQLKFGEELSAAWSFRQSFRATQKNIEKYPDFYLHYKTLGIQQIIIGSAPERHQWLLKLLGFHGTVEEGLRNLEIFSQKAEFRKLESELTLAFIYSHLLQNGERSLEILTDYQDLSSSHPLVNFSFISILSKLSKNEEAYKHLTDFNLNGYSVPFPFNKYLQGNLLLQRGNYKKSIDSYSGFTEEFRGRNYLKDAKYKIGIAYHLLEDETNSNLWFYRAKSTKPMVTEADRYASHALNTVLPDKRLIRVRLFTDGGYYDKSKNILSGILFEELKNPRDKIELKYRWARLYHKLGENEKSIPFYEEVIDLTYTDQWYFAPNAALQLGYIHLEKGALKLAKEYFEKSLEYNNHPYQNSIDNKAKTGLSKIKRLSQKSQD